MTEVEGSRISPALHRFLEETDEEGESKAHVGISEEIGLGVLDITTTETSLRGELLSCLMPPERASIPTKSGTDESQDDSIP
jgi:hypothetical protein